MAQEARGDWRHILSIQFAKVMSVEASPRGYRTEMKLGEEVLVYSLTSYCSHAFSIVCKIRFLLLEQ